MIKKVPIIDSPIGPRDLIYAMGRAGDKFTITELEAAMSRHTGCRYAHAADSGIASLYIILKALSAASNKTEVILPAYTAGSLVVAVRKAGLRPVLADVSMKDFNADTGSIVRAVTGDTLAVVCVHMFGVEMSGIRELKGSLPAGVAVIEDCAQAMGSRIGPSPVGRFGDVAFFSFNRGKNIAACGGGCIVTDDAGISESVTRIKNSLGLARTRLEVISLLKLAAFAAAVNPYIYGTFFGIISRFKDTAPPMDFDAAEISCFDAALAISLIGRFEEYARRRNENGIFLLNALGGIGGVTVPSIPALDRPVFNRFPVVFRDHAARDAALEMLWSSGVESSRMYVRPLHHMFDLGYRREGFPNACEIARRILTLPVHPSVGRRDLARCVEAIRRAVK